MKFADTQKRMQALLRRIPTGKITTYRELAHALGTRGYRFVGQLLHTNPDGDTYPCYKVVCSDGRLGGYAEGQAEKIRRLKADGIVVKDGKVVNFKGVLYRFKK